MKQFITIDIGGTSIKYGVLQVQDNGDKVFLEKGEMPSEALEKGGPGIVAKVQNIVKDFQNKYDCSGVGISTAGVVDEDAGKIIHAIGNIPDFIGTDFKKGIAEVSNLLVEVDNDVNCAGLAESKSSVCKDAKSVLVLTIGTGIGGAFIQEGQVLHGNSHSACEVGYIPMDGTIFERLGSTSALVNNIAKRKNEPVSQWNGRKIFEGIQNNDDQCIEAVEDMCDVLGKGLALISYILNPEVIVLGGGIMGQKEYLKPRIEKKYQEHMQIPLMKSTRIELAENGNDAGMLGAYYNFITRHPEIMESNEA